MTTVQFLNAVLDWLLADPAHVAVAASVIAAATGTPNPNTWQGKLYRVLDLIAINIGKAKETGSPVPTALSIDTTNGAQTHA